MIAKRTKLEELKRMHDRLYRAKEDLGMVSHYLGSGRDGDTLREISNRIEQVMWRVETDIRFEQRMTDMFKPGEPSDE